MKSFHLSGLKFYIAAEMFCVVELLNFLLGGIYQKQTQAWMSGDVILQILQKHISQYLA